MKLLSLGNSSFEVPAKLLSLGCDGYPTIIGITIYLFQQYHGERVVCFSVG